MPNYEFFCHTCTLLKGAGFHRIQGRHDRLSALWQRGSGAEMVLLSHG
jgi:hypothetical protein